MLHNQISQSHTKKILEGFMNIRKCSTNIVREHSLVIPVRLRKSTSKQQKS